MAEAILFGLAKKVIERLGSMAVEEIGAIWGVKDELQKLKETVSTIQAVLQDAEEKQEQENQVRDWLMKLKDVAYDADDVMSTFSTEDLRRSVMGGAKMTKKVRTFFSSSNQLAFCLKMAHKIKAIREKLDAIGNDRTKLQLVERPLQTRVVTRERDQTHSYICEEEVIGRENEKKTIIDMLLNSDEEENVSFISIVGIGGLGKTTLAQYVFNDEKVKTYFDLKMWVCVSDVFDVKVIAEKIIRCTTDTKVENLDIMEQVQNKLREHLDQKKYLLVLDDVWNENGEKWSHLKRLLMGGSKGSKVVITTRSRFVAKITSPISPYFLQGLSQNQSWFLFKQMAFGKGQETINPKLEEIGMGILKKCYGVPLAIKTIGRILYFKETEDEWSKIKDQELTTITHEENNILPILKLSYDHLPSHLKCCFTYCSLFPKDSKISRLTLIQLWIAQGFIQPRDEKLQLEDVANEYCMDLLSRSFFQEVEEDDFRNIISFKMHDLIHDVARIVSRFECRYVDSNAKVVNEKVRHLSFLVDNDFGENLSSFVKAKKIRTFLTFGYESLQEESTLKKLISSFRCLHVLDISGLGIVTVPNSINKLTYLKYLDLSCNNIEVLPNSFIRLVNLQTLKLSWCKRLKKLPRDIQKLVSLQHLEIDGCQNLTHVPCGIVQLISLQTLNLSKCEKLKELPRDIQKLVSLKHLEIDYCESLTHMSCGLWQLTSLQTLKLYGEFKELPKYIQKLVTLRHLEIDSWKSLTHMPYGIGQLTSLQTLPLFVVSKDLKASSSKHCGGLAELNKLNNLRGKLCIKNLAWVTDATLEAKAANLKEKRHLRSLKLSWDSKDNNDTYVSDDENLLEGLQPYHTLKELKVEGYRGVSFPSWLPSVTSLVKLKISDSMCQHLPPLCQLPSLRELFLKDMTGLEYISDREITDEVSASTTFFPSLKSLKLWRCPNLKGWWRRDIVDAATTTSISSDQYQQHISLPSFPCLSDLDIWNCNNLTCMPLFQYLEESLYLRNTSLKPLQETMAMTMNMSATSSLPSSSSSSRPLSKLKSLTLFGIQDVKSLPEELLKNLASLQRLHISDCPNLTSLPEGIGNLTSLQRLQIYKCPNLTSLPEGIGNLTSLQSLDISYCPNLTSLPEGIGNLTSLQSLDISYCPNLTSLPEGIGNLTSLQRLQIYKCPNLTSLPEGIGNLTSLQSLDISYYPNLTSLPEGIGNLTSLQRLRIDKCRNLTSLLEGIGNLTSLQSLDISYCPNLTSLPEGIGNLTSLQSLDISDCPNLTSLPEGIGNLTSLQRLDISDCPNLTLIPEGVGNLTSLQRLQIKECPNLNSLPEGIGKLTSLQTLAIWNCPHLKERCQEGIGEDWHKIAHIPDFQYV